MKNSRSGSPDIGSTDRRKAQGFTLIEILLVVGLMSMIGLATYRALVSGITIWRHSQQLTVEEDIAIFFDKFAADLRNSFVCSQLAFKGEEHHLTFPTLTLERKGRRAMLRSGKYFRQIGQVEYRYDVSKDSIIRREANYGQALKKELGPPRLLVSSVKAFDFHYLYFADDKAESALDSKRGVPQAVEVAVEFKGSEKRNLRVRRLFYIPVQE